MSRTKVYMHFESEEQFLSKITEVNDGESHNKYDPYDQETFVLWPDLAKESDQVAVNENGEEYNVLVPVPGFHVDAYLTDPDSLPEELAVHVISTPDNPVHKLR